MTAADEPKSEAAAPPASAAEEAPVEDKRRLLVAGDAEGNLVKLFAQVENQQKKVDKFDLCLAVGAFLPAVGGEGAKAAAAGLADFVAGRRKASLDTYFIESRSAAFLQTAPGGRQLCDRVHFLGGFGIREIQGLRVAYLSGRYDSEVYSAQAQSDSGPAFVGAAYTPHAIKALVQLAQEQDSSPIDVLLTAEWPSGLLDNVLDAEKPVDPDGGVAIDWQSISAPPLAELVMALEPRYHIFGAGDLFYKRPPFQTRRRGHVCRSIGLGKVGSRGAGRLWIHGLALSPASSMPSAALMQRPANTTPLPFAVADAAASLKREAAKMEQDAADGVNDSGHIIPDKVFLSRLPANVEERTLETALRCAGKIESVKVAREQDGACKGYGWVTFSTPEEAEAACELSDMLECGGRKIQIKLSKTTKNSGNKRKKDISIVLEPHSDCWFCLCNPKAEKHMIAMSGAEVYVASARGPIVPSHVMLLSVKHAPCFAACPAPLQQSFQKHVQAVRSMCHQGGQECLIWERWIPMSLSAANHMQIQIVPFDANMAERAREVLQDTFKQLMPGAILRRVHSHDEVVQHMNDDSATPYVYFEIPGDRTAKERVIERYVYAGVDPEGPRIPVNIGRKVACTLLDCDGKVDWRKCTEDRETEKELAAAFRERFKPFRPTKA